MSNIAEKLKTIDIFKNIDTEKFSNCLRQYNVIEKRIRKGAQLIWQGDTYSSLLVVVSGRLKGEMINKSGKTVKVEMLDVPGLIAPAILFAEDNTMPVTVCAEADCGIIKIKKEHFKKLLSCHKPLLDGYLRLISNKFLFMSQRFHQMSSLTLEEKILSYLKKLPERGDGGHYLDQSLEELAGYFGVTRPSLSRSMINLQDKGCITKKDRWIWVKSE